MAYLRKQQNNCIGKDCNAVATFEVITAEGMTIRGYCLRCARRVLANQLWFEKNAGTRRRERSA